MSTLNGRQKKALEGLADALKPRDELATALAEALRPTENLATALRTVIQIKLPTEPPAVTGWRARHVARVSVLTECLEAAVQAGTKHVDARLGKMDETLRMLWKQCGGRENQRLPIDD